MGKAPCELQLSIQKSTKKDKKIDEFYQFLHDLRNGKNGVLAELASTICQYDPITSLSN